MNTPSQRPECQSSLLRGVATFSDQELVQQFQQDPKTARYFIGLCCRYEPLLDQLIGQQVFGQLEVSRHSQRIWRSIYQQLLHLPSPPDLGQWLQAATEAYLEANVEPDPTPAFPPADLVWDSLSPALACYLRLGMERLPGDLRFILVLSDKFHWSASQIAAQLQLDGYPLSPDQAQAAVKQARQLLLQHLPPDVRALYLSSKP